MARVVLQSTGNAHGGLGFESRKANNFVQASFADKRKNAFETAMILLELQYYSA